MNKEETLKKVNESLDIINQKLPFANLVIDENEIQEINETWIVKCQNKQFLESGKIKDRLHAFPEPYLIVDKNGDKIYFCRNTDDSILLSDYQCFKENSYSELEWEEVNSKFYESLSSTRLNRKKVYPSNQSPVTKEEALKLVEQELEHEDYRDDHFRIIVSNIEDLGEVWFVGCSSEKILKTNKVQDMLMGGTSFLIDKESNKMYAIGAGHLDDILEDYLYYKYGWHSEMQWEPVNS